LPRRLPQRDAARATLAQLLRERYKPSTAPRSFTRQEEIDQVSILAAWYRERREGLAYVDLPSVDPAECLAASWAGAILDGQALDVGWEIPKNQGEQEPEAARQDIEQGGCPIVVGDAVLDMAG